MILSRGTAPQVGLSALAEREGLATVKAWEDVLSLGEQQRMGLARVFFHRPHRAVRLRAGEAEAAHARVP